MQRPWMRVLASVFALSLLAACSSNDDDAPAGDGGGGATETSSPSAETGGGGGGADLTIVDFAFSPKHLSVSDGDTITIQNIGDATHTFTTEDGSIDETVPSGDEIQVTIEGVSSQGFHCRFHSQMQGTLTVD